MSINNKALTIQGAGSGATTITGVSGHDTIAIDGAKGVLVSGLTVQGGKNGIAAGQGAVVEVTDAVIQDAAERGILAGKNATVQLSNLTVQGSGTEGILAILSSSVVFTGTVASNNNLKHGISVVDSSSALFSSAAVTANANGHHGISVANNSGLLVDASSVTIQNGQGSANNGRGIQAFGGSSVFLQNASSLLSQGNGLDGVGVGSASSFYLDATSTMTVRTAQRYGILVWSNASMQLGGTALVENNAGNGIAVLMSSNLFVQGTAALTIQNNVNTGLNVYQGTAQVDPAAMLTVSGTTGSGVGVNLGNKSALGVNGGLLVQNNTGTVGRGIQVANGSQLTLYPTAPKTVVVQNNGVGVNVWDGGGVSGYGVPGSGAITIKSNTTRDLDVNFGSRANLQVESYDTINCSQSYTTMGVSCP